MPRCALHLHSRHELHPFHFRANQNIVGPPPFSNLISSLKYARLCTSTAASHLVAVRERLEQPVDPPAYMNEKHRRRRGNQHLSVLSSERDQLILDIHLAPVRIRECQG